MKNLMKYNLMAFLLASVIFFSCNENDELLAPKKDSKYADSLVLNDKKNIDRTVFVKDLPEGAKEFKILAKFASTDAKMKRLYMTENIAGKGNEAYELQLEGLDKKKDGSLDISNKQGDGFQFELTFPVLASLTEGTVVYQLWATSGRGDYRNTDEKLAVGVGTLTVNYGGQNPATAVKAFSAKILAAPLADGTSKTFVSLIDGELYTIKQGEEYAAFWDFGYYYGAAGSSKGEDASLASTSAYENAFQGNAGPIVDVDGIAGTTELNSTYFKKSSKTIAEFDAVTGSKDLDFITKSTDEKINNLAADDVIEFVDNYGKKGLIKVIEIKGTYNQNDFIKIDIKVQP